MLHAEQFSTCSRLVQPVRRRTTVPPVAQPVADLPADVLRQQDGNLTSDPELHHSPGGTARATFRVAVSGRVRDGEQWRDGEPAFYTVAVWRDQTVHTAASLAKGSRVAVVGRLGAAVLAGRRRCHQFGGRGRGRRAGAEPQVGDGEHHQVDEEPRAPAFSRYVRLVR
jgi:hypothetical protein